MKNLIRQELTLARAEGIEEGRKEGYEEGLKEADIAYKQGKADVEQKWVEEEAKRGPD